MDEAAAVEPNTPLLLACGHELGEVVQADEGTAYCAACEREARDSDALAEVIEGSPETSAGERQDGASLDLVPSPPQPVYGTRSDMPGPRGCWALNSRGEPCGAMKRRDGDFCTAHSGLGVASDPSRYSPLAHEARRRQLQARAELRLVLGDRGRVSARSVLREQANREAARLAGRAIGAALNPETDDVKAAQLALGIIREAEPRESATLAVSGELTSEAVEGMGLSELLAVADRLGITPADPSSTPAEAVVEAAP